jgi:hypothetical protein
MSASSRPTGSGAPAPTAVTRRCPDRAAHEHVLVSHGQPCSRAHCSTSRCPPPAATHDVVASHLQPVLRSHSNTSRFPQYAACEQAFCKHNRPMYATAAVILTCLAHRMSMDDATAAAHPRPAPASEARALGPSRPSTSLRKRSAGRSPSTGPSSGDGEGAPCAAFVIGSCGGR